MDWSGVDYCDVFISCLDSHSDGTHSLQSIHWWCNATFLQICSLEETNSFTSWMAWECVKQIFSKFLFWVNYSFKLDSHCWLWQIRKVDLRGLTLLAARCCLSCRCWTRWAGMRLVCRLRTLPSNAAWTRRTGPKGAEPRDARCLSKHTQLHTHNDPSHELLNTSNHPARLSLCLTVISSPCGSSWTVWGSALIGIGWVRACIQQMWDLTCASVS